KCIVNHVSTSQKSVRKGRRISRTTSVRAVQKPQVRQMRHYPQSSAVPTILNETVRMTQDSTPASERRGSQRFRISAPVTVISGEHEIPAYTRDLSNRGVYFYIALSDSTLIDRDFEFTIEMPSEITLSTSCRIRCRGKLVRKEVTSRNLTGAGIAAEIMDYSILRNIVATN
ncbi:MAG: PilZ domain-containing protein, partial [Formivibrio sp.]|nr:PilZ domain-containing protein [Formivibrio sp.]